MDNEWAAKSSPQRSPEDLNQSLAQSRHLFLCGCAICLVAQSCLTLCIPMHCIPPGSSVHRDSPGQNTGVGSHSLLQGIFLTQGSNSGLPHCRQISSPSVPPGKPKNTEVGSLSFLQWIFTTQESNWGLLYCRQILYQMSHK